MKILTGLLLLPFCAAISRTLWHIVTALSLDGASLSPSTWGLLLGFVVWLVLYFCSPRPVKAYVLAHELTHALWGRLMGARVSRLRVSARGGSVTLSKSNFLITLAPYFFPFYTLLALALYGLASLFFDLRPYEPFWLGCVGLTWGFHLTFTISTLQQHQPDVRVHGRLFSYAFIYLMNLLGVVAWIVIVASPTWAEVGRRFGADLLWVAVQVRDLALRGWAAWPLTARGFSR